MMGFECIFSSYAATTGALISDPGDTAADRLPNDASFRTQWPSSASEKGR